MTDKDIANCWDLSKVQIIVDDKVVYDNAKGGILNNKYNRRTNAFKRKICRTNAKEQRDFGNFSL